VYACVVVFKDLHTCICMPYFLAGPLWLLDTACTCMVSHIYLSALHIS